MKKTLRQMAFESELSTRFAAREDDKNSNLTDFEIYDEAKYQLQDIPYKPWVDDEPEIAEKAMKQMKAIIRKYEKEHK